MFVYYINTPLNAKGIAEFESYATDMPNVYTEELSEKEYQKLSYGKSSLFSEFFEQLHVNIDTGEEERIPLNLVDQAAQITMKKIRTSKDPVELCGLRKVEEALVKAKNAGTFTEFDFYVD